MGAVLGYGSRKAGDGPLRTTSIVFGVMQPYKKLRVVESVRTVIKSTYQFTRSLPRDEQFGLSSQMRRAAVSIGLNIVEGTSRRSLKDGLRFLDTARSSGMELDFGLLVSADLSLGVESDRNEASTQLQIALRQLSALIKARRAMVNRSL